MTNNPNQTNLSADDISDKIVKKIEDGKKYTTDQIFDVFKEDLDKLNEAEKEKLIKSFEEKIKKKNMDIKKAVSEEERTKFKEEMQAYIRIINDIKFSEVIKKDFDALSEKDLTHFINSLPKVPVAKGNPFTKIDPKILKLKNFANLNVDEEIYVKGKICKITSKGTTSNIIVKFKNSKIESIMPSFVDVYSLNDIKSAFEKIKAENKDPSKPEDLEKSNKENEKLKKENEKLQEENKNLKDKLDKLEKELAEIKQMLKDLKEGKKDDNEKKEDVEKVNEVTRDLDNKDINYKKQLKAKVENMRIGGILILTRGGAQIAKLTKKDKNGFVLNQTTDEELKKLIDKDYYIIENGNKSYISYVSNEDLRKFINFDEEEKPKPEPKPEPEPEPTKQEDLELSAVISDMGTDVHRERVSLETEEELRDYYKGLPWYRLDKRAYLFLSRGKKRKNMIDEKMKATEKQSFTIKNKDFDQELESASDRHSLEKDGYGLSSIVSKATVDDPQVNELCKKYLQGSIDENTFKAEFNKITADPQTILGKALEGQKDIKYIGTNVLEKLNLQKASSKLMSDVNTEFEAYTNDKQEKHIDAINKIIEDYIKDYQQNPGFLADYQNYLQDKDPSKLKLFFKHNEAIMKMQIQNLKVKIDVLTGGKSAYQIDNKDRQKGRAYKLGHKLDKLPRRAQTAGFVGLSIGTGLLTGGLGTVASAAIVTGVSAGSVGGLNALKKWTHYTKEQNIHEKNVATDYRKEQEKIKERQEQALNGKRYQWKTYKAKRQLALYDQSTQENFEISNTITDTITDLCSQVRKLNTQEENYIKKNLIQGKVRLDYYRDIGHNFLASNEKAKIEKDMRRLEKAIILGSNKLGISLADIASLQAKDDNGTDLNYTNIKKDLENSYNKSLIQFKRERRVLAAKYGVGTAVASAGMSLGMQRLFGTGVFADKPIPGTTSGIGTTETFDPGKHNLLDTGTSNTIHDTAQSISSNPNINSSSIIEINYGAGTDATSVIPGRLTESIYNAKIQEVINNINSMKGLNTTIRDQLIDHVKSQPRKASRATSNFTNDLLHGMRCSEVVEQAARGLADSGYNHGVKIAYDSSYDIIGKGVHNVAERVVNADFVLNNPGTGNSRRERLVIPVPLWFNTFKDRILDKKPEDKKPEEPKNKDINPEDKNKPNDKEPEKILPKTPPIEDKPGRWKKRREEKGNNPFKDDDFEPITPKPFDKDKKIGVTPRAIFFNGIDIKPEDLGKEYPNEFKFKTPEEIADIVLNSGVPLYRDKRYENLYQDTLKIEESLKKGDRKTAKEILVKSIKSERGFIEKEKEFYDIAINRSFEIIDKSFNELLGDRSLLPDKSKVHIVGAYEFRGQRGGYKENILGFCSYMDGELFINRDALFYSGGGKLDKANEDLVQKRLIHTITHEIVHGTSTANYWHQYKDETKLGREDINNIYPNARRLGNQLTRFIKNKDGSIIIKERGRALNEAITETFTIDIIKKELSIDAPSNCYLEERDILNTLCKVYNIDIKDFYKVLVNRKNSLKDINKRLEEKMAGNKKIETPSFYTLLMSVMDYEFDQKKGYKLTKTLINGEQLVITPEMKKYFHPGLLKDGIIKEYIQKAYPNLLDQQAKSIAA